MNVKKNELKEKNSPIKVKLTRKRLYPSRLVKYLGIKIDEKLNSKQHDTTIKLSRANALLFAVKNDVNRHILRLIHFSTFDTHIYYATLIWKENVNAVSRIVVLKEKALGMINFQAREPHTSPLFKSNHFLKVKDKMPIDCILITNKLFNNLLPLIFNSRFTFCSDAHNYQAVSSSSDKKFKASYRTDFYRKK